jgi:hypothetical protein
MMTRREGLELSVVTLSQSAACSGQSEDRVQSRKVHVHVN